MTISTETKALRALRQGIGTEIREARLRKRLTLRELSTRAHLPVHNLDLYELGRGEITLTHLVKIRLALRMNPHAAP